MRVVEIGFSEKKLLLKSEEYPKFKELWTRMLTWVGLIAAEDWQDFKFFLEARYNRVSNRSQLILERLLDAIPVEGRIISGTNLYKQCFPRQKELSFDEKLKYFGKELHQVIQVVQHYLSHAELRRDTKMQQKLLLNSLKFKNNHELFQEVVVKFSATLKKEPLTLMQAKDNWELHHLNYNHPGTQTANYTDSSFTDAFYAFETFTQLAYLNYYFESLHHNVKLKSQDQLFIKSKAEPILNQPGGLAELVQLYVLSTKMALSNDLAEYPKFEELYTTHHHQLEATAHLNIIKSMFNIFFNLFISTGKEEMAEQSFHWMKKAWDLRLYNQQGSINDADYINFMILTYFLKKEELFVEFKKEYEPLLDPGIAKDVKAFCDIRLCFEKSNYNEALRLLNTHFPLGATVIDPKYNIRVKGLRIMIYLSMMLGHQTLSQDLEELNQEGQKYTLYDLLINSLNALRQYCSRLRKHRLDEYLLIGNQRFVKIVRLFAEYELAKNMADGGREKQQLLKEIEDAMNESRPLAYRRWLKKMFATLKPKL